MMPILKNVLVISINPANTKMLEEIAIANPAVQFDYATTTEITNVNLPNVNVIYMDLYYNVPSTLITLENSKDIVNYANKSASVGFYFWLKEFLENNIENYDFVFAAVTQLQTMDWFHKFRSKRPIFCTDQFSARLERNKLFAKQILRDIGIPTPKVTLLDITNIEDKLDTLPLPIVIKTSLGSGPLGSWVLKPDTYKNEIKVFLSNIENIKGAVYTEEFISGPEISAHFLCNGTSWQYIGAARDYKRSLDNDQGLNTNGTGCYSPVDYFTDSIKQQVFSYMDKILAYLNNIAIYYKGFMYLGLILDSNGVPNLLEINARPGTPEILTILDNVDNSNLLENLYRSATGMDLLDIIPKSGYSVAVGLMNKDFPPESQSPKFTSNIPDIIELPTDLKLYEHCGIFINKSCYGFVTATGTTKEDASNKIYEYLTLIKMNDYRYRTDIGLLE
jgi:phosphoribosylamine--glycine ligase